MRKLFIISLVALLLGVGVVALIEADPGYVLLSFGNYTLEASLWVGLLLFALLLLAVYLLVRLTYRIIGGQRSLFSWLGTRKVDKALRLSTRGLISFTEGNWVEARRQLLSGVQNNEAPLINYLLAAQSSAKLHDTDKVPEYLHAAGEAEPTAAVAIEMMHAEMKLQASEYKQALALLTQAKSNVPRHPYVLSLLSQAYQGLNDWDTLLELLPQLRKHKQLSSEAFQRLEKQVHHNRLQRCNADLDRLHAIWKKVPKPLQSDVGIAEIYVRNLIKCEDYDSAERVILHALKQAWQPALVREYGYLKGQNASRQLSQAEKWLKAHPDDPQLLLCLGRLSARNQVWSKSRLYFESSYRVEHSAEICAELGRLLTSFGESEAANAYFREGLLLSEDELPDLALPLKIATDA
jgi:HemY protein